MLEDPLLRVGLVDYPARSLLYVTMKIITLQQLNFTACNGTRYSYPTQQHVVMQNGYGSEMGDTVYGRSSEFGVMTNYHDRAGMSMSPSSGLFCPAKWFAYRLFRDWTSGVALARHQLSMQTLSGAQEFDGKTNGHDAGHYAQNWHGGYSLPHASMHMVPLSRSGVSRVHQAPAHTRSHRQLGARRLS